MRVQVIGPNENSLFACWYGKGSNACHDVADHLSGLEFLDESAVLGLQTAVPVYAGVVEVEFAALLVLNYIEVVLTGQQFKGECAELTLRADIFDLVDDCADSGVFVFDYFCDEILEWEPLLAEVQVYCLSLVSSSLAGVGQKHTNVPHLRESLRDFCVLLLGQDGVHNFS